MAGSGTLSITIDNNVRQAHWPLAALVNQVSSKAFSNYYLNLLLTVLIDIVLPCPLPPECHSTPIKWLFTMVNSTTLDMIRPF